MKPSPSYSLLIFVYLTSQLRHSLVVHPVLSKILDPLLKHIYTLSIILLVERSQVIYHREQRWYTEWSTSNFSLNHVLHFYRNVLASAINVVSGCRPFNKTMQSHILGMGALPQRSCDFVRKCEKYWRVLHPMLDGSTLHEHQFPLWWLYLWAEWCRSIHTPLGLCADKGPSLQWLRRQGLSPLCFYFQSCHHNWTLR